ncbi:ExbD/TolR family protein [Melioribacteraceae bacterium 4301-Me]|uniref:ExbD/TolR family protein n=1 Tax=Pyranulibacter aquaticus TaxID=3163344 RepID=UPI0035961B8D
MKFETSNKPLSMFSYSSLTDIVMLLLIFFLLTSQFVITTGVKVKLPAAKNNEQAAPSKLVVSINDQGKVFLGSDEITTDLLPAKLESIKNKTGENNLIIRADKSASIDIVIKVIDAGKGVGIDKFTIETEKQNY